MSEKKKKTFKDYAIITAKTLLGILGLGITAAVAKDEISFNKWLSNASEQELEDAYESRRQEWIKTSKTGDRTYEMEKINKEINKRTAIEWKNDPRRNKDPNYRWTDANRWDKD